MNIIDEYKRIAKYTKKYSNPDNLTLMQIQHNLVVCNGYRNWKDFLEKNKE